MKLRTTLATILLAALAAPTAFAQPRVDVHANVRIAPPPMGDHGRRDWKFEHPVVVGHTPLRGKPGQKIVIRGHNFGHDTVVVWGGNPIPGAVIAEDNITFTVPPGAANGTLYLRGGGLTTDLPIGDYEIAADAAAQQKAEDDAMRAQAQADWDAKMKQMGHDRAARDAALAAEEQQMESSREERREHYYAELQAQYDHDFLLDRNTMAELAQHAERLAKLERIQRLVADEGDAKLGLRVSIDIKRENKRHDHRMAVLKAAFKGA